MKKKITQAFEQELSFFMMLPAVLWQLIFFCIPILIIFGFSFIALSDAGVWQGFTLAHYTSLLDVVHVRIFFRSLGMALFNALVCLVLAYPIAYYLACKVRKGKNLLLFLLTLPFWTNFLIQVYAWFFILERNGLINKVLLRLGLIKQPLYLAHNIGAVAIVMVYCYVPFMIMPLYSILEKLKKEVIEASHDLGASSWQTFLRVILPLSLPGVRTGFFLVFVPSFGEFAIPALMGGSKHLFVGSLISHYFLVARDSFAGSAFTCLSGFALLIIVLFLYWSFSRKNS